MMTKSLSFWGPQLLRCWFHILHRVLVSLKITCVVIWRPSRQVKAMPCFCLLIRRQPLPNARDPNGRKVGPVSMGGCQNYDLLLGSLNTRCRIVLRIQKRTIILTSTHILQAPK